MARRHHFGFAKNDKVAFGGLVTGAELTRFALAAEHRHLRGKTPIFSAAFQCGAEGWLAWRQGFASARDNAKKAPPVKGGAFLEQATGIEPASPAWEAGVLPLDYACGLFYYNQFLGVCQAPRLKSL